MSAPGWLVQSHRGLEGKNRATWIVNWLAEKGENLRHNQTYLDEFVGEPEKIVRIKTVAPLLTREGANSELGFRVIDGLTWGHALRCEALTAIEQYLREGPG